MRQVALSSRARLSAIVGAAALLVGCKAGVTGVPENMDSGTVDRSSPPRDTARDMTASDAPKPGEDAACATARAGAEPVPLALYMMMDTSRSMLNTTIGTTTKWDAVKQAMMGFFNDGQSAGTAVGLAYFPAEQAALPATCMTDSQCPGTTCDRRKLCVRTDTVSMSSPTFFCADNSACMSGETCANLQGCGNPLTNYCTSGGATATCPANCSEVAGYCHTRDICDAAVYATPVVAINPLPGAATNLLASLAGRTPDGYTPTAPALKGAIQQAQQYSAAHPEYKVAVVLVTDGLPGGLTDLYASGTLVRGIPRAECEPLDIPSIVSIASNAAAGANGIPTFVIGVFSDTEATAGQVQPKLDMLAAGGGTDKAVIINTASDVTQALQSALNKIRTTAIACQYKIPPPTTGVIDLHKVNVKFVGSNGDTTTLGYGVGKDSCGPKVGWYYDVDPDADAGTPTSINICPSNCSQFQADTAGHVDIELGCMTFVIP